MSLYKIPDSKTTQYYEPLSEISVN